MGPAPSLAPELATSLGNNIDRPSDSASWEKAPAHMVDYDECPSLKTDELKRITGLAAVDRSDERDAQASALKLKYPDLWNKRSGAKIIASLETEEGNPLSERTVQRLFKITGN